MRLGRAWRSFARCLSVARFAWALQAWLGGLPKVELGTSKPGRVGWLLDWARLGHRRRGLTGESLVIVEFRGENEQIGREKNEGER